MSDHPHLCLVSDFPLRVRTKPPTIDDYIIILNGWQIALAMSSLMLFAAGLGAMGVWLWHLGL